MRDSDADNKDQAMQLIESVHGRIAAFARESHQKYGRGVILLAVPLLARGDDAPISTEMAYHTAANFEQLLDRLGDVERVIIGDTRLFLSDAHAILRMIKTYDPSRQAVVSVRIGDHHTVSVKMKLERPLVVDESERIH